MLKNTMTDTFVKKQRNRTQEIKFIRAVKTPLNPKDVYYRNLEELIKYYFLMILVGVFMVFYMIFY